MHTKTKLTLLTYLLTTATTAFAIPVQIDFLKSTPSNFYSVAVDATTGQYYESRGFEGQRTISVYDDLAAFGTNNANSTVTLNGGTQYGTYAGARDGVFYARSGNQDTLYSTWDTSTGNRTNTADLDGFDHRNGPGTFDWGGWSGLNTLTNQTSTYIIGGDASNIPNNTPDLWRVEELDVDLNSTFVANIDVPQTQSGGFGWSFLIGDFLFFGNDFRSDNISTRFNVRTGEQLLVDFTLQLAGRNWWSNTVYDHFTDTLVAYNTEKRSYYTISDAMTVFGVSNITSVPEPGTLVLMFIGGLLLVNARRARGRRCR